jgi:hypothetical protein
MLIILLLTTMKKLIKSLVCVSLLGLATFEASAVTSVTLINIPAGMTNILSLSNQVNFVTSIVASSTNAAATRVQLFDSSTTTNYYVTAAYTNITWTNGTRSEIYTNFVGTVYTNTFAASIPTTNTVAAATNAFASPVAFLIPSATNNNNTVTWTSSGVRFGNGVLVSNSLPVTLTITSQTFTQ